MILNGPYSNMLDDEVRKLVRKMQKNSSKTVMHQQICPICGAKNVNIYKRQIKTPVPLWMCRKCWEEVCESGESEQ